MRARWMAALLAVLAGGPVDALSAQSASWSVRNDAAIDLWFHGLAVVGTQGPGPLPYTSASYLGEVRLQKTRGMKRSTLDAAAPALRTAFAGDSAFEVLHFLPLYLSRGPAGGDPARLIAQLRAIAARAPPSTGDRAVDTVLGGVFKTREQRDVLKRFVDALADEQDQFFREYRETYADGARRFLILLEARWNREIAPVIAPYVHALGVRHGVLLLSPAIGREGRIVRAADAVTIVVGWAPRDSVGDAPILAAVRELCFPFVERAFATLESRPPSRLAAIDITSRAAVRCGAMLLEARGSPLADNYRRLYVSADGDAAALARRFDAMYAMSPALERSLRAELARATSGPRAMLP